MTERRSVQAPPPPHRRLSDPRAIRAVSHPVRLALIETLTLRGTLTATEAGELIGESPTTCSFHLRQLARYGFVEEAGGGVGRARPWRMAHLGWTTSTGAEDAESDVAAEALGELALRRQIDRHESARRGRSALPAEWQEVREQSQTVWWVTPGEARQLQANISELLLRFRERITDPAARPVGAQPVEFVALMHPFGLPSARAGDAPSEESVGVDHRE